MQPDPFVLNRPEELSIQVRPIATTRFPMLIVDDVYRDPHAVRELALALPYEPLGANNPGARAEVASKSAIGEVQRLVQQHVGEAYGWQGVDDEVAARTGARFHRMEYPGAASSSDVGMPHIDTVMLAGVVYLNLPDQCRGGTSFFRHRTTGIAEWRVRTTEPVAPAAARAAMTLGFGDDFRRGVQEGRWQSYDELRALIFDGPEGPRDFMSDGSDDWIKIDEVEMRWNRLVCFPGFVFHTSHCHPSWFGTTAETSRLIQNFLFYWPLAARTEEHPLHPTMAADA